MVNFEEVKKGYNKEQVESYIKTINDEYQKILDEYQALEDELEETKKDTLYKEAIAAALVNAEIAGKQVLANAHLEAKRVISEAEREVSKLIEKKNRVLAEIDKLSKMLDEILAIHLNTGSQNEGDKNENRDDECKEEQSNAEEP